MIAKYKINTENTIAFLYTSNKQNVDFWKQCHIPSHENFQVDRNKCNNHGNDGKTLSKDNEGRWGGVGRGKVVAGEWRQLCFNDNVTKRVKKDSEESQNKRRESDHAHGWKATYWGHTTAVLPQVTYRLRTQSQRKPQQVFSENINRRFKWSCKAQNTTAEQGGGTTFLPPGAVCSLARCSMYFIS